MKTELKAKFLQHLTQKKKKDEGFTLIELLVVIIIIGILSAIALPSFLNQANKGKQAEAKQYVGSLNRAQQAYYVENTAFASSVENVGIGIKTQTDNYTYDIGGTFSGTTAEVTNKGTSNKDALRSYAGVAYLTTLGANSETSALATLCEATSAGTAPVDDATGGSCPENFAELKTK
jgi:prepilin-type N-terminal cleavage/methylation domain-containing protein